METPTSNSRGEFIAKGFEFSFIHPPSKSCDKGLLGEREAIYISIDDLNETNAKLKALEKAPKCEDCGEIYLNQTFNKVYS